MLAAEVAAAARPAWWEPWSPSDAGTVRRLDTVEAEWLGPGEASLSAGHLTLRGPRGRQRQTGLRTIEGVVRRRAAVWVRRRQAHDWLVRFEQAPTARAFARALRRSAGVP